MILIKKTTSISMLEIYNYAKSITLTDLVKLMHKLVQKTNHMSNRLHKSSGCRTCIVGTRVGLYAKVIMLLRKKTMSRSMFKIYKYAKSFTLIDLMRLMYKLVQKTNHMSNMININMRGLQFAPKKSSLCKYIREIFLLVKDQCA